MWLFAFGELANSKPPSNRLAPDAKLVANETLRIALFVEIDDFLVSIESALPTLLFQRSDAVVS